ncbi:hypothetical protein LT330_010577 [Penicillium expansum]|nr:hypothetical protein LT330_010577 [Penicillium expansum]
MSNRNHRIEDSFPDLGSIEGQDIPAAARGESNNRRRRRNTSSHRGPSDNISTGIEQIESDAEPDGESNRRNNDNNRRRRRNTSSYRGPSDNISTGIEQIESDAEPDGESNRRNNGNNRRDQNDSHTSDHTPPGIERVESDAEEGAENIPVHEEDFSSEAEIFLQPMWSTPELLEYTAETSGLPMEGSILAWRGNGYGKSVIVGYARGGFVTARLIPAARRQIPPRAPNILDQSLGRRKDDIRTELDIGAWGLVAWRVDKKSVDQDPISLLKPMNRAWYPETYVYILWRDGHRSWESRDNLRYTCASDERKTDILIYNLAKEQETNYQEALTGVRPQYPPANTHMKNEHWRNVNAYGGAHWLQPRAQENRRITTIAYEPVIPREVDSQEYDSGIGMSDRGTIEEVSGEYQEGYYEGPNEGEEIDNFEGGEDVQNDREEEFGDMQQPQHNLSPIAEEGSDSEGGSFFTPNGSPSRVRWHNESRQRYGVLTPRTTRSPSSGYIPQRNRDQARRMPETPNNRRVPHLNPDNQQRTPQSNQGNQPGQGSQQRPTSQRQTPQSVHSSRSTQPGNQQRTPQSNLDQGGQQRQTPQRQTPQRQTPQRPTPQRQTPQRQTPQRQTPQRQTPQRQTPQSDPNQGGQQRQTPQRQTPQSDPDQGGQQRQTPQRQTPQSDPDQGGQQRQTPQRQTPQRQTPQRQTPQRPTPQRPTTQRPTPQRPTPQRPTPQRPTPQRQTPQRQTPQSDPYQGGQQRQTPQRQTPQSDPDEGGQQRQTPQSNRSNRSNQASQPGQGSQQRPTSQRQTPQSNRSNRSNRSNQASQPSQGIQQRQTPQSNPNQDGQQRQTPQRQTPQRQTPQRQTPQRQTPQRQTPQSDPNQGGQQRQTPQRQTPQSDPDQGGQQRQTPQSNRSNRSNQASQPGQGSQQRPTSQRQTPQSNLSNRSDHNQIDHPSTESSTAVPEGNRIPTQIGRGQGRRPRRINTTEAIRRSARLGLRRP